MYAVYHSELHSIHPGLASVLAREIACARLGDFHAIAARSGMQSPHKNSGSAAMNRMDGSCHKEMVLVARKGSATLCVKPSVVCVCVC